MWKRAENPCSSKKSVSTGGVGKSGGLSTGRKIVHIYPSTFHNLVWMSYSYLALMLVVMSLMISAFSGSVLTRLSMRFKALRTVLWSRPLNS